MLSKEDKILENEKKKKRNYVVRIECGFKGRQN
jgi:hypothetical protein